MIDARVDFTATLLPDGKVLVAGGDRGWNAVPRALASAELYDPATRTWTATASMTSGRYRHTATLLPNGKVLVAGGNVDSSGVVGIGCCLATAELYDPSSGTWTATGSMNAPRVDHSSTLLLDGTVLVAGGDAYPNTGLERFSAELYDPATERWTATGNMIEVVHHHKATLLSDGTVLVGSSQRYDPSTRSWSSTDCVVGQPVEEERFGPCNIGYYGTATLLTDGTLLLAGGTPTVLYDPASGIWTAIGGMIPSRVDFTATLLPGGKVLAAGGTGSGFPDLARTSAELYDPSAASWAPTASMAEGRYRHVAILLLDGTVLVAGGSGTSVLVDAATLEYLPPDLASAEVYDPGNGS
jgi:hypothetical protein